ncbi:phage tail protein [Anaeromusa acidaminophila]|uniref:phage tail protein n=1 Tax=Anaeromusa acidaminophila TaxID=81464 RepID=UPI000A032A98
MIAWYTAPTPPPGWLECNGQSTAAHPELAAIVGPNVPDLRGEFIRGWDHGAGKDVSRLLGSWQNYSVEDFKIGFYLNGTLYYDSITTGSIGPGGAYPRLANGSINTYVLRPIKNDSSGNLISLSNETRSRNVALLPCIKY